MSNVVSLRKPAKEIRSQGNSDKRLIDECVIYAQSMAAFEGGFNADPGFNKDNAARLGGAHADRAHDALEKLATMPAKTAETLQAKARIVPLIINQDCALEEDEEGFILSFAADVKAFLQAAPKAGA